MSTSDYSLSVYPKLLIGEFCNADNWPLVGCRYLDHLKYMKPSPERVQERISEISKALQTGSWRFDIPYCQTQSIWHDPLLLTGVGVVVSAIFSLVSARWTREIRLTPLEKSIRKTMTTTSFFLSTYYIVTQPLSLNTSITIISGFLLDGIFSYYLITKDFINNFARAGKNAHTFIPVMAPHAA